MKTLIFFLIGFASTSYGMDALDIMKKAHFNSYYLGKDGKSQLLMKVYPKGGGKPIKKLFYMLRLDIEDGGEQMFFTYFVKPTDIKRTTFLVHKKINSDDYRRLYIPASDKTLAISGSRKQDPFMGSDFTYEDVSGRHYSHDTHVLLNEEKLNGEVVFVTESKPKKKEDVIKSIKAWISKKNLIPMKVEYTNHNGKVYRRYLSGEIVDIQGFKTITKRTMFSLLDGTKTEMLVNKKKTKYNIGLESKIFSERSLKNPPMKFLK
ncbi:outer membrane lipoprotein-sorting protein [Bacteriovoracaceae bacterium]|nr:outer membrane lipoprotein-sorting protein [Bacteriovoracaceae bacterium]